MPPNVGNTQIQNCNYYGCHIKWQSWFLQHGKRIKMKCLDLAVSLTIFLSSIKQLSRNFQIFIAEKTMSPKNNEIFRAI